jgi:membrane protein
VKRNARELPHRARAFLTEGLWLHELEPRTWTTRGVRLLQFAYMVGEGFVRDQLLLRASALTYFTVLSLVPMVAIAVSIAHTVGVTENVAGAIVERIAAGSPTAQAKILETIQSAKLGGLGTLGGVMLFLTTVLGISNIERALNLIWGARQQRSWARRIPDYLAVLVVAPLLLGAGLSLGTTLNSQWLVQRLLEYPVFVRVYDLGLSLAPTLVLALAFAFLYGFLPNTKVKPGAALLGGLVAGLLVDLAQTAYLGLSVGAARASALYGGFAQLPLLFVWIYFFWAIVLFGAEIAFAWQNLELYVREVRGERAGPAEREAIGLRIALEIARSFRSGDGAWTSDGLSDAMRVPARTVRDVLVPLERARIVSAVAGDAPAWQLGRPAEQISLTDVLAALRGPREPIGGDQPVARVAEAALAELAEGAAKAAAGHTLAELAAQLPPTPARART